jgi:hypothetical protein
MWVFSSPLEEETICGRCYRTLRNLVKIKVTRHKETFFLFLTSRGLALKSAEQLKSLIQGARPKKIVNSELFGPGQSKCFRGFVTLLSELPGHILPEIKACFH